MSGATEHSDEMLEQPSVARALPLDASLVVRRNPFEDIRPFIEHLWITRTNMCRNIYPDEFPRGTKEKYATKEQEDEFILRYFSAQDLHKQGGRFLKQVLYSIAKYNEDNVLSRAAAWAEQYESFYANPGMSTSQIRNVLDEHQGAYFPDSFLCRAVLVINYGLKQLRDMQDKEATNGTTIERASSAQAALQRNTGPVDAPQHEQTFFDAARQASFVPSRLASNTLPSTVQDPQQSYMAGQPQNEHIRYGPSLLHGQSRGNRAVPRQSQRQENRGRHRRSSGSMHSPQLPMGPMLPLQQMVPINTATGFPDFDPSVSGFVEPPPGYPPVSYQMPLDDHFAPPNMHANADYYPSISYARAPKPRMPLQNGNIAHQSTNGPGYYTGGVDAQFQHQIPGSFNQPRPGFSPAPNSPRVVDPHSFSRFPDERYSQQRPYMSQGSRGGHRTSFNSGRTRRSSVRSGDGWQGQRDSRPFEGPQRRVLSDQRAYLAQERRYEARENRSQSDIVGEHGYPLQRSQRQSQTFQQTSVPDNDPDWSCGSDFIGQRRVDVNTLVMTDLQPNFSASALEEYITGVVNHKRVVVTCNNTHKSIAFVRFSTHTDANHALGIRNMTFDGISVTLRVPFKFWKATDHKYFPPAHARQHIESGEWYRSRHGSYGTSAGGSHQLRDSGRSERSTATSEVGHQFQIPQFASTDEAFDANMNALVLEGSTTSDPSDSATHTGGYYGPVLPSLSEASTPQKHSAIVQDISQHSPWKSPTKQRAMAAPVDDDQFSEAESPPQISYASVADVTSTAATPVTEFVANEAASSLTRRASSPLSIALIEEPQDDKESLTENHSPISNYDKQGDSSPKEDADDSFQTAAETPEASARIFTPRSTPVETEKPGIEEAHLATPTPKLSVGNTLSTTHSPASITESDDTASISTTAGQSLISNVQPDKVSAARLGPKQTESLSPFARQAQAKKKDVRSKSLKSRSKTEVMSTNLDKGKTNSSNRASHPEGLSEHSEHIGHSPAKSKDENMAGPGHLKEAKISDQLDASLTEERAVQSGNDDPPNSKAKVDEEMHGLPTILQPRDVLSKGDQKTLSTLSSVTALLTGALSSMGSSKTKAEIGVPETCHLGENEPTAYTSAIVQSEDGGFTATPQPEITTSTATKKPKKNKNKRKKKPKNITPVREEDVSSTETLAHETPAGSPMSSKASAQPHSSTGGALCERTNMLDKNMLDNTLSGLGIREGSIVELGPNSIGYRATNAGSIRENLNLRGVEGEVEKSRRKMQEMEEKERLLKLRKG